MHSFLVAVKSKSRFHVVFLMNWLLLEEEEKEDCDGGYNAVLMLMVYKTKKIEAHIFSIVPSTLFK